MDKEINKSDLWDDAKQAQATLKKRSTIDKTITNFQSLVSAHEDCSMLWDAAVEEDDENTIQEVLNEITKLQNKISISKTECMFSKPEDSHNCFLEINAGAGGTESNDWALMLLRMYMRWCETHDFKTQIISRVDGEEAGIKSVTVKITGERAYGWIKTEGGVHRLVRISPFDSNARRHTSFASVWVYPEIEDSIEIEINPDELSIDTYKSSGAGGQHVNTTDSAVRITHKPTGIIVQSQSDRSQHKNKEECMSLLRARLYEMALREKQSKIEELNSEKTDIGWGHQIRSYVLHPYQMVKDLRTSYETGNTAAVLDGSLDQFILAYLAQKSTE